MLVLLSAGGKGPRLRPLTLGRPHSLLPIANRPLILHHIAACQRQGLPVMVAGGRSTAGIRAVVGTEHGPVQYTASDEQSGLAAAARLAAARGCDLVMVVPVDVLVDLDAARLRAAHVQGGHDLTVVDLPGPSVIWIASAARLAGLKGAPHNLPDLAAAESAGRFPAPADTIALSHPRAYLEANARVVTGESPFTPAGRPAGDGIWAGPGARIGQDTVIAGQVAVGARAILRGARVEGWAAIGDGCAVERGAVLRRTVVQEYCYIGRGVQLEDCIIGTETLIGEGARLSRMVVAADSIIARGSAGLETGEVS